MGLTIHVSDEHSIPTECAGEPEVSQWHTGHVLHWWASWALPVTPVTQQSTEVAQLHWNSTGEWTFHATRYQA